MKKEYSIGLFAIVSIIILIFGYSYLKGNAVFDSASHYYVRYDEVNQLEKSAKVYVNGFDVGTVLDMTLDPEDADFMIIELRIKEDISFPNNTIALLLSDGVFGGKSISLEFDQVCTGTDCLKHGDFIQGGQKGALSSLIGDPNELDEYLSKIESGLSGTFNSINERMGSPDENDKLTLTLFALHKTALNIQEITTNLSGMLEQSAMHYTNTMKNLAHITKTIAVNDEHISKTIANIDSISLQLKKADLGETVTKTNLVMDKLDVGLDQFTSTLVETKESLSSLNILLSSINEGEGTLGKLSTDSSVYVNLNESLMQLELLMQDLRLNPKRYINVSVFGKKSKAYTLPDEDPAKK